MAVFLRRRRHDAPLQRLVSLSAKIVPKSHKTLVSTARSTSSSSMSHSSHTSLVGSIVERKAGTSVSPPGKASAKSGFPVAQHRSKSAFARAREEQKKAEGNSRLPRPPTVTKTAASSPLVRKSDDGEEEDSKAEVIAKASEDWRRQMEEDNQRRVENMSAEELEDARQQILKQFGPDIAEILKQSRATRDNERVKAGIPSNKPVRPSTPRTEAKLLKSALLQFASSFSPVSNGSPRCYSL